MKENYPLQINKMPYVDPLKLPSQRLSEGVYLTNPKSSLIEAFSISSNKPGKNFSENKDSSFQYMYLFLRVGWTPRLLLTEEINEDEKAEVASNLTHLRLYNRCVVKVHCKHTLDLRQTLRTSPVFINCGVTSNRE